jgi:hypothetical protein
VVAMTVQGVYAVLMGACLAALIVWFLGRRSR